MSQHTRRVVVSGVGVVSPIGLGRDAFWSRLCAGGSGVAPMERVPESARLPTVAAAVRAFNAKDYITSVHLRRMDRFSRMIVAAGRMALADAGVAIERETPERVGVVVGSALGDTSESTVFLEKVFSKGPAAASPLVFPNLVLNAAASYTSMELGATGVNFTVAQAETSGEQAIMLACEMLRAGRADIVVAGGGDELPPILFDIYRSTSALSGQRGGGEWSSPYDAARNGVVLGEGAAMLTLESPERAQARGACVYAEIDDDCSFSVPAPLYDWPTAASAALPMLRRLTANGAVDLICGSANSSRHLDACELDLFHQLCGDAAGDVFLASLKGAIGEFGAAGALSAAAACLALREQRVPPLCHLRQADPQARFRFAVPNAVPARLDRALVCGLGRGGAGVAISFRRST